MPQNYKDTLNLPKTDCPMKANLTAREPEILRTWEETRCRSDKDAAGGYAHGGAFAELANALLAAQPQRLTA